MQCKDIPDEPILQFLAGWSPVCTTWFWSDDYKPPNSVVNAMPPETPAKLALAKMGSMIRKGIVTGCPCGCRGDFEITDKGRGLLKSGLQ